MRGKWKNVCGPLAERGKLDVNDFQTKVRTTQTGLAQPPIFFFLKRA